ncbi:psbP domain-containing protein 5, chloroplastic isoform X1 [Diospyros lotus]|uniref:psbP domain-containing protein 5, chloroplastic isoform X1 n=1 Tax=Diospyros lotus TaxID=55363 RepID=UPI0022567646|nr:psbP domain-containing protein 5, chloroplastic isoform X1 [Diospyros lotus]
MKAMATVHLFPSHYHSHFLCTSNYPLLPYPYLYRKRAGAARVSSDERKCRVVGKIVLCSCAPLDPNLENGRFSRRDLMKFFGFSSSLAIIFPPSGLSSTKEVEMASLIDDINAYSYLYPTELPSKKFVFKWVESRKPERYSSAAPLAPDARLRIVSERVDIIDNLVISISIGPPNAQFLKSKDKSTWNAKDVADSVLSDKAALRITSSQRMAESSILDAHSSVIDGEPYWYYEYLVRKSPTQSAQESNIFRHYISSTAERDGYLYSLSASTLGKQWNLMGPFLEKTAASFRLLPPTENYVPPYKDPWRFW